MIETRKMNSEKGSVLVMAMLLIVLLMLLGMGLVAMSETELLIAHNDQLSEAAFQAADAAVQHGIDGLTVGSTNAVVPNTGIGDGFVFRSGGRDDNSPQPPELIGSVRAPGYSAGTGTGYNYSGYQFRVFAVSGTGTGPRNAQHEVEVQILLGPFE